MAIWGGVRLVIFGLMLFLLVVVTTMGSDVAAPVLLKRLMVLLGLSAVCYSIYWGWMLPWRIQLRITIKTATANDPKPTTRYDAKSASDSNRKPTTSSEAS